MIIRKYKDSVTGEEREEMVLSREEQESEYARCLQDLYNRPRDFLDKLDSLDEFKVNWKRYDKRKDGKTRP